MDGLERFDNFLITIVQETGGVEGLLNSLFSFLYRRTDFFYEMMPGEKMGFLPGEAERMVDLGSEDLGCHNFQAVSKSVLQKASTKRSQGGQEET